METTSVVIVGAGPAGLAAAITLARLEIPCLVVDSLRSRSGAARATVVSAGAMERLRRWGIHERAEEQALDVEMRGWRAPSLRRIEDGAAFELGMLTPAQARVVSPARPTCLSQDRLEPLLEEHLRTLPAAQVALGTTFTGLEQDPNGVTVRLGERTVRAAYVIGADGLRSAVRAAAGVEIETSGALSDSVGAQLRAPLWELIPRDRRFGLYATAAGTLIPVGGDRWIYATERGPGVEATAPALAGLVRAAAGAPDLPVDVDRVIELRYATALARAFGAGRVFLAGDAAHRVTPRGATGMSMALIGGEAVAWRLAWVLRGWASPELLDAYERERRPIAAHNIARSARRNGSEQLAEQQWRLDVGGRIAHAWVAPGESTVDLVGLGRTLFTGPDRSAWAALAPHAPGAPVRVRALPADAARALGLTGRGAIMTRPDGIPVGLWTSDRHAEAALAEA
ncbi:FAD-dependent monooxygenase [Solirubrobacter sp. CPCC 204708]|uniref:FAD-dependent monooxygenase n=1 Tax=Solirubrobacter deserti TaxID=2282478 RepID=A0ABT4RD92_9ACTN|nr:FAD-dependent monooxygenase [Solirubrobacter deserti]MBE2317714.1 FAD-dependent monooxygenase [Solirubrobacter deserti]MDA0136509.1 FAD-dependent monooxygenase [Solirubrobacter deserti]